MRSGRVQAHEGVIYYEVHGDGPAVLFCHGAGSNSATWWQQIPEFSRDFTCITYDHRGFGRSQDAGHAFDPAVLVDDALAVLDAAGVERAALVCQSLGGVTGLRLALGHPGRVWAFVPCDSPLGIAHEQMQESISRWAQDGIARVEERALAPSFVGAQPALAHLYGQIGRFNAQDEGLRRRVAQLLSPAHLLPCSRLESLACPTLFVVGTQDRLVTPPIVRDVARFVPGSTVIEIEGAGHSPYFEQPAMFNAQVCAFLKSQLPRRDRADLMFHGIL
jgi:3-oxoadipate enol-lactonase